jgi:hypothetical protein
MTIQGYDLVGDIHGHADALQRLFHAVSGGQRRASERPARLMMSSASDQSESSSAA